MTLVKMALINEMTLGSMKMGLPLVLERPSEVCHLVVKCDPVFLSKLIAEN